MHFELKSRESLEPNADHLNINEKSGMALVEEWSQMVLDHAIKGTSKKLISMLYLFAPLNNPQVKSEVPSFNRESVMAFLVKIFPQQQEGIS
ncbi:MAG: hypothetical protein WCJ84_04110 [Candidatus Peregrinibacteria bacterium]